MKFDVPEHWAWNDAMNHEIVVRTEARGYPEYPSRFVSVPESNGLSYVSIRFVSLPLRDLVKATVVSLAQMGVDYELRVGEMDGDQVFLYKWIAARREKSKSTLNPLIAKLGSLGTVTK